MLFDPNNTRFNSIQYDVAAAKKVAIDILRLDEIHPIASGNKLFKLNYFLEQALSSTHCTILTFGGAWSNHLLATAYACRLSGIKCIGIVRGEQPQQLSPVLQECIEYGMRLKYISRDLYARKDQGTVLSSLKAEFGECLIVPEGGYDGNGARGASLIMNTARGRGYTHIVTAIGTATTLAGLLMTSEKGQTIIGVPVLKGMTDIEKRISFLTNNKADQTRLKICDEYHFDGYAKYTPELIDFMNQCWKAFSIPLDFVYTGKMMFAIFDLIKKDRFAEGSKILCLHTGGLSGNRSLAPGRLMY